MPSPAEPADGGQSPTPLFVGDRAGIAVAATLLVSSGVFWVLTYYSMPLMTMGNAGMGTMQAAGAFSLASSLEPGAVGLFEMVWVLGMAAMMFPAMIPVVRFYDKAVTRIEPNPARARAVGTPLFLTGYLGMYAGLGLSIYLAAFLVYSLLPPSLASLAVFAPSLVLVVAGAYQLSPLKSRCLSQCVSPIRFFAAHSHRGFLGSLRMGVAHGAYCVGCCWAYMAVMVVVAVMALPFMAALAGVIALEKVIVRGAVWYTRAVGAGLAALGVSSLFAPQILALLSTGL
jgi:predicted metal-binding membrane protein